MPGVHRYKSRIDAFHLERDGYKDAKHPKSADDGVKQIRVFLRSTSNERASWSHCRKLNHMLTNRTHLKIIFAVNICSKTAAQCGPHRTRDDRRPPTVRLDVLPKLLKCDARLASHQAGSWIPFLNLIHAGHI